MRIPVRQSAVKVDGFGFIQFENDDILIYGGFRVKGPSSSDFIRLAFHALDRTTLDTAGQEASKLAYLELTLDRADPPRVLELVRIDVPKAKQRQGHGERVVAAVAGATQGGELKIIDIKKSAIGFWKKMGVEINERQMRQIDGTLSVDLELDYAPAGP